MAESVLAQDLRSFLRLLEDEGELARIESSVELNQEIGAVCLRNLRNSGPGLFSNAPAITISAWLSISWRRAAGMP